jgi:hypothetical protein
MSVLNGGAAGICAALTVGNTTIRATAPTDMVRTDSFRIAHLRSSRRHLRRMTGHAPTAFSICAAHRVPPPTQMTQTTGPTPSTESRLWCVERMGVYTVDSYSARKSHVLARRALVAQWKLEPHLNVVTCSGIKNIKNKVDSARPNAVQTYAREVECRPWRARAGLSSRERRAQWSD